MDGMIVDPNPENGLLGITRSHKGEEGANKLVGNSAALMYPAFREAIQR